MRSISSGGSWEIHHRAEGTPHSTLFHRDLRRTFVFEVCERSGVKCLLFPFHYHSARGTFQNTNVTVSKSSWRVLPPPPLCSEQAPSTQGTTPSCVRPATPLHPLPPLLSPLRTLCTPRARAPMEGAGLLWFHGLPVYVLRIPHLSASNIVLLLRLTKTSYG